MSIGAVSYLNALPLIHGLPYPVRTETPRQLLDLLQRQELSLALLSSVCLFNAPNLYLVPGMGIGSCGRVDSVRLFFNTPNRLIPQLKSVASSPHSNTANMLLQLFLKQSGYTKGVVQSAADATPDAALVIGDDALIHPNPHGSVDLGQWWWEWTGLPFVFAAWISRTPTISAAVYENLMRCKTENVADIARCLDACTTPSNISRMRQENYLTQFVHYELGDFELQGLQRFRDECIHAELVSDAHPIRLATIS